MWKPRVNEEGRVCIRYLVLMNNFTLLEVRGLWSLLLKGGSTLARAQGSKDWQGFEVEMLVEISLSIF